MKLFFLLIPLTIFSCKTVENSDVTNATIKENIVSLNKEQPHNIEISIKTKEPYCGGAQPREEDLNRFSVGEFKYLLINLTNNNTSTIKSSPNGIIYLNLKLGKYEIRELYKDMSFSEFKEKNKPKENESIENIEADCYKKWWTENLLKFEVTSITGVTTHKATINKMCFKGKNPCVVYNGYLPN